MNCLVLLESLIFIELYFFIFIAFYLKSHHRIDWTESKMAARWSLIGQSPRCWRGGSRLDWFKIA